MNLIKREPTFFDDDTFDFPTRLLGRSFFPEGSFRGAEMPAVNIKDAGNEFQIELAVPGYKKEDLHVDLEDGVLTISSEKREEKKEEKDLYRRREFSYSSFRRSFALPEIADEAGVKATHGDGVLRLTVAKRKDAIKAKPARTIAIK